MINKELYSFQSNVNVINVCARDDKLEYEQLEYFFKTYKNLILLGDLNAKHDDLLTHAQKTKYNRNGIELKTFLEGIGNIHNTKTNVNIHNINDTSEWTHNADGEWAQIDYIITHLDIHTKL